VTPGMTVLELAAALGRSPTWTRTLLLEAERRGIVRLVGKRWRPTAEGYRRAAGRLEP
jgi:DNA-binding Lrp family transcriptional regulator